MSIELFRTRRYIEPVKTAIALAEGDGIGPEIMKATLNVLHAAGVSLDFHKIEIGERLFSQGNLSGISPASLEILKNSAAFLKAPITEPSESWFNATIRAALGIYANIIPCASYSPFTATLHPEMNLSIIYENEEDLSAGIEYHQTPNVCNALKIISRAGCERIIRTAFEYARQQKRKEVACFTKESVLKLTDGLFIKVFNEIAQEYPEILSEHWSFDAGAAKLADEPEDFDLIVAPTFCGELLSAVASRISGSKNLIGSAHIGESHALFEPIHDSAPHLTRTNSANPSGMINAAAQMLAHIGQPATAETIHNAWLCTLEDGIHTEDLYRDGVSQKKVGTQEFGEAVIERLGKKPGLLKPSALGAAVDPARTRPRSLGYHASHLVGVDVTIHHRGPFSSFFPQISHITIGPLKLKMISNRGRRIWPKGFSETLPIEQWICRFTTEEGRATSQDDIIKVLHAFDHVRIEVIKADFLYTFEGKPGYG